MTKIFFRILMTLALGLSLSCENSEPKSEPGSKKNDPDCFSQLHPGKVKGGEMDMVVFQHGACLGLYKALNKYTARSHVYIMPSADSTDVSLGSKSKIYVSRDGSASVKTADGKRAIGKVVGKDPDFALVLDSGVEFNLIISDADEGMKMWQLGDGHMARKTEEIAIYIP